MDSTTGLPVASCAFDSNTYHNPDSSSLNVARQTLDSNGGIVLLPQRPLTPGHKYAVSIEARAQVYNWSFEISPTNAPAATRAGAAGTNAIGSTRGFCIGDTFGINSKFFGCYNEAAHSFDWVQAVSSGDTLTCHGIEM